MRGDAIADDESFNVAEYTTGGNFDGSQPLSNEEIVKFSRLLSPKSWYNNAQWRQYLAWSLIGEGPMSRRLLRLAAYITLILSFVSLAYVAAVTQEYLVPAAVIAGFIMGVVAVVLVITRKE